MVALESEGQQPFVGAQYGQSQPYSEQTASLIDSEIRRITEEGYKKAYDIIQSHRDQHKVIAEALLKYETLDAKQILSLFNTGKMPEDDTEESVEATTFEEAKKALEKKEAERVAKLSKDQKEVDGENQDNSDSSTKDNSISNKEDN